MSNKNLFKKLLRVEEHEIGRVMLLLIMSFFLGSFIASFTVASQTLFLLSYNEAEYLPRAFFVAGLIGLFATLVYNALQNRISFQALGILSLLTITILTALIEFSELFFPGNTNIHFLAFTQLLPFTFISLLVFWGAFNRMFNVKQSKRLLGSVDLGYVFASLIAFFTIPVILEINLIETSDLYTICLASIICFTILFIVLVRKYVVKVWSFQREKLENRKISLKDFFKNKYILYMSMFIVVSMTSMNFVDYSFLNVAPSFFKDQDFLPQFLSLFEATIVIFSFLFQTFVSDRIIDDYGLRVAMLINPVVIGLFTVAALVLGLVFGYTPDDPSFVIFVIMIAMSKLFVISMRESLDEPALKLYMLPIDSSLRIDVSTKLEGVVIAFASMVAGGVLILIYENNLTELIYFTILLLPLIVVWYVSGNKMYDSYRHTLRNALAKSKNRRNEDDEREYLVERVLERQVNSTIEDRVLYGLKLMEKLEPAMFESTALRLTESSNSKIRTFAQEKIKSLGLEEDQSNQEIQRLANAALGEAEDSDLISVSTDNLMRLSKSPKKNDRILAAKLLRRMVSQRTIFILLELLRDIDPKVRIEALKTARKVKRPETWSILIELLASPTYSNHSAAALIENGEAILLTLDTAFHKSGQSDLVKMRLIQLIGRIGTPSGFELLWRKIDYPDKRIVRQILYSLRYVRFETDTLKVRNVIDLLDVEIGKTLWNMAALDELPDDDIFAMLKSAIREDIRTNFDQITMLLAMIYDPNSVQLVRENIESGDPDNIQYALELLDLFISPELKPKLFPLLDDNPVKDKLNQLQTFYPRESYNPIQVINYILNRDFNQNNRWTKACAIYASAYIPDFRVSRGLISQMFNSDKVLQETAAWVIYNKDRRRYEEISERLPDRDKKFLESSIRNNQVLDGLDDGFFLAIETIMFLKTLPPFQNISGVQIADLADKIVALDLLAGEMISINNADQNPPLFIVAHGSVKLTREDRVLRQMEKGDVFGDLFENTPSEINPDALVARERSVVFQINLMDFYFVLANHHELVEGLIKNVAGKPVVND